MFVFHEQNAQQMHNRSVESVSEFRHLGTTVTAVTNITTVTAVTNVQL